MEHPICFPQRWIFTMIHKPMLEEDYKNLCDQLNIRLAFQIEGAGLKCDSFAAVSCLMKKFLLTINKFSIDNAMSCLYNFAFTNNDLKNISACLVSPFGLQHFMISIVLKLKREIIKKSNYAK